MDRKWWLVIAGCATHARRAGASADGMVGRYPRQAPFGDRPVDGFEYFRLSDGLERSGAFIY